MNAQRLQTFRLQFIGSAIDSEVVQETVIRAADLAEAEREARALDWPPGAYAYRLLDLDGKEMAQMFRADR